MGRFIKPVCCICGEAGETFDDPNWEYQDFCPKHSLLLKNEKMKNRATEIKEEIKKYKAMLSEPDCDFAAQTWIGLAIQELKKELKSLKTAPLNKK